MNVKDVFQILVDNDLVKRVDDNWAVTDKGEKLGGTKKKHPKIGEYIAWNENIKNNSIFKTENEVDKFINATALSNYFGVSKFKINPILSELGFIEKSIKGWTATALGISIGGKQYEYERTGIPYVNWPKSILQNKRLVETMNEISGTDIESKEEIEPKSNVHFRQKYEAKHRAADGHYVRSRAEMLIDNWLYMSGIVHAYERKLPIEEDVYTDFYLPVGRVYIEYWGLEDNPKYKARKQEKLKIYEKYGFNLIQLKDADIQNLDDILPKKLLKFGIQAY
ncbi:glycerol kinase [Virgibacillus salarius]|uniref:glycerol kinase n=1 Tax=Virgibacillus salarius TaxID=447199 RepID=UPI0031D94264